MNFGKTILELRKKRNVTQEEMAAELGVTAAAVSKWENNYTLPDIMMLCALADYFQVTTDTLLGRVKETKLAVIAAETMELGRKMQAMAKEYGIATKEIFLSYPEARKAAETAPAMDYVIIGYFDGAFVDDCPVQKLVSISETENDLLDKLRWVFDNFLNTP